MGLVLDFCAYKCRMKTTTYEKYRENDPISLNYSKRCDEIFIDNL